MSLVTSVKNYQSGFPYTSPPAPDGYRLINNQIIRARKAKAGWQTIGGKVSYHEEGDEMGMGNFLTDVSNVLFAPITNDVNAAIIDVRNALTIITILAGIGAATGLISLMKR